MVREGNSRCYGALRWEIWLLSSCWWCHWWVRSSRQEERERKDWLEFEKRLDGHFFSSREWSYVDLSWLPLPPLSLSLTHTHRCLLNLNLCAERQMQDILWPFVVVWVWNAYMSAQEALYECRWAHFLTHYAVICLFSIWMVMHNNIVMLWRYMSL